MFKRKRVEDIQDSEMMDVQVFHKDDNVLNLDPIQCLAQPDPKILSLLQTIMPSSEVSLVENCVEPLGVVPREDHCKKITGKEVLELARDITLADNQARFKVTHKLEMIAEQINFLRQQAVKVIKEGQESVMLNHVPCNIRKVPGQTYHLYKRPSGQVYFSVLSLEDWQGRCPHTYCGAFTYQLDNTWRSVNSGILSVD